jgi:Domain of unknown function (DUF3471)
MKKLLLLIITSSAFGLINAQTPAPEDSLKEYTGKYKFPEGNPVAEIVISIENGVLTATSAIGGSELKRREGDVFDVIAYSGTAIFKRNDDKKIVKLQVQVNDLDMEGEKAAEGSLSDIFWRYRK